MTKTETQYDVVIVGGGATGLSAALTLGRARRSVVVVDAGEPRNAPSHAVHGFFTRDGVSPAELLRVGRKEVTGYGVQIIDGRAAATERSENGFTVSLDNGSTVTGRRLLIATGIIDKLPDIPGVAEQWGKDVLHCPYCHGWEIRDQAIGVLGTASASVHQALLFRQWSADVTLFLNDSIQPTKEETAQLRGRGITIVDGAIDHLEVSDGKLQAVTLADGQAIPLQNAIVAPRFQARVDAFHGVGVTAKPHPSGLGECVEVDETCATGGPGIWAAGNVADLAGQVLSSAAAGADAGIAINADLMDEDVQAAARD